MFLDKKTLLKIWLNSCILIRGWFFCNAMQKQPKQNKNKTKTKQTNKSYLLIIAFVRVSQNKSCSVIFLKQLLNPKNLRQIKVEAWRMG